MRVLDSFGTDAEFNYKYYKEKIPGGRSPWGDLDFHLPQFMTMYRKYNNCFWLEHFVLLITILLLVDYRNLLSCQFLVGHENIHAMRNML